MIMKPPNKRLKLTAPSVHAFCFAAGVKILSAGRKSATLGPQLNRSVRLTFGGNAL